MKTIYFTITGCNHHLGTKFFEKGMSVKLIKEPDNEWDKEAIKVEVDGLGTVGHVANEGYMTLLVIMQPGLWCLCLMAGSYAGFMRGVL